MSTDRAPHDVLARLEASGRAIARGTADEAAGVESLTASEVIAALSASVFDLSSLEDAGIALVEALSVDELDGAVLPAGVQSAFEARDRVEHVLLGAERALGSPPVLSREQQMYLAELDELVRPSLHRLTTWNEPRGTAAAAISPAWRSRFWWWTEGAGIAPSALASLAAVAELVACFPAAHHELDALVSTARTLRAAARAPASRASDVTTLPTTLSAWVARRRRGSDAELRIAAASDQERVAVATSHEYDVSFRPPASVVVDLHVEPREGAVPHARLPSGRALSASLVPRTLHRYAIALDASALGEERLVVILPLSGGDIEIAIPPAAR